ncbi:DUF1499 domain-containing protein [Bosea sp. 117]|uniref:DUF1499 domain-containing protein n=1 Tax=Bosea sp. 117 TaxID=1125973 RepID=UPI000493BBB6|nr:DUF1499 domain-containing protein [Bosea sp. 117]
MIRRRLYIEERMSQLAVWSLRTAVFAIPVTVLGVALYWTETLDFEAAIRTVLAGLGLSALALLLALAAFIVIWNVGLKGLGRVIGAAVLAAFMLAPPAAIAALGLRLPAIHDVTTDVEDPPTFRALGFARSRAANPLDYAGGEVTRQQQDAYPGIKPIEFDATPDEIYNSLVSLVTRRKWHVIGATPPRGGLREGRIEAVARGLPFGLREDIVIRVRPTESGVRVDMRSVSRHGERDFGSNARRIDSLLADLAEERGRPRR